MNIILEDVERLLKIAAALKIGAETFLAYIKKLANKNGEKEKLEAAIKRIKKINMELLGDPINPVDLDLIEAELEKFKKDLGSTKDLTIATKNIDKIKKSRSGGGKKAMKKKVVKKKVVKKKVPK